MASLWGTGTTLFCWVAQQDGGVARFSLKQNAADILSYLEQSPQAYSSYKKVTLVATEHSPKYRKLNF